MGQDSKLASKVKAQMTRFSNRITRGLSKPTSRFISQMIYGIQASKDVKLSNVCRSLGERIALIKTENRLSRQINQRDLTAFLNRKLAEEARYYITKDTVLGVDLSDIQKPHGKKMECLAEVRDGSTKTIGLGYWLCHVFGATVDGERLVPLYGELYSQAADDFESENTQILKAVDTVNEQAAGKGIWVIDRGGDRYILISSFVRRNLKLVIRLVGNRHLILESGKRRLAKKIARTIKYTEKYEVEIDREGRKEKRVLQLGSRLVRIPKINQWMRLVVIKGFAEEPMLLITNVEATNHRIMEIYLTRWKCEECFRFLKQIYHLEDVRVRGYTGLRNTVVLVQAVFYFICVELAQKFKLNILLKKLYEKAQRFFGIPSFKFYAIADGIYKVLFGTVWKTSKAKNPIGPQQLAFEFMKTIE